MRTVPVKFKPVSVHTGQHEGTEGPWTSSSQTEGGASVIGHHGEAVAWCGISGSTDGVAVDIKQAHANAALIAAAPDLLKQLDHLVLLLSGVDDGSLQVPGLATLNGARAALAKARNAGATYLRLYYRTGKDANITSHVRSGTVKNLCGVDSGVDGYIHVTSNLGDVQCRRCLAQLKKEGIG